MQTSGGAIDIELDFSVEGQALGVLQFIDDSSSDIFDETFEFDRFTFVTGIGTIFVVRIRREEGALCRR
jgi:DUF4097 and DUF4098 domain-containing protein YvlB